jgi:hypothetical protein
LLDLSVYFAGDSKQDSMLAEVLLDFSDISAGRELPETARWAGTRSTLWL